MVERLSVEKSRLGISSYAGSQVLTELMEQAGVSRVTSQVRVKKINSGYTDQQMVCLAALLIANGFSDFVSVREVRDDSVIMHFLGLENIPHANSYREYFERVDEGSQLTLKRLSNTPLSCAALLADPIGLVPVDFDGSILVQYGRKKEGAKWAYNGEFGYNALFGFIGRQGYCMEASLRPGNHTDVVGAARILEKAFDRLPEQIAALDLLFRFDAGFYSREIVRMIRALEKHFLIKAKLTSRLRQAIEDLPETAWKSDPENGKVAYAELRYCPDEWELEERFVVLRERDGGTLLPMYNYVPLVTNLTHEPKEVVECYRRRGQAENFIKEIQYDLHLEKLPSGKFDTNQAFLQAGVLAYNLMVLLGELNSRANSKNPNTIGRETISTIRRKYLIVAGYIRKHSRRMTLMTSKNFSLLKEYLMLLGIIRTLKPLTG